MRHGSGHMYTASMAERVLDYIPDKLAEANFFLDRMEDAARDFFAFRCYFSAFLSASRSVTFTLQTVMEDTDGFAGWYEERRKDLSAEPIARFLLDKRNLSVHAGASGIVGGVTHFRDDGEVVVRYYFHGTPPEAALADSGQEPDVLTVSRQYMKLLIRIVLDWQRDFSHLIDPEVYLTARALEAKGRTTEDLEEELGFPRGWTAVLSDDPEERLRALRRELPPAFDLSWLTSKYFGDSDAPPAQGPT
jgi:hypothetical protein